MQRKHQWRIRVGRKLIDGTENGRSMCHPPSPWSFRFAGSVEREPPGYTSESTAVKHARHFFADVSSELLHISVTKVETAL